MSFLNFFRRAKSDGEAERRAGLLRAGRITEGTVFDVVTDAEGSITHVFFNYNINGVDYESSQALDDSQRRRQADYAPGARVTIRFNPRQPGNSVVV